MADSRAAIDAPPSAPRAASISPSGLRAPTPPTTPSRKRKWQAAGVSPDALESLEDRARWVDGPIGRGENIYPSAIEDALRAIDGFGGEFRVIVSRREAMDELLVRAEHTAGHGARLDALRSTMRERLRARLGVHPVSTWCPRARCRAPSSRPGA